MTAPIGTSANRFTGIREFSQVTNSYGGYLQSAGTGTYSLVLPFRPDRFDWFRYTGFGTNDIDIQGVWFRDFPAADSLVIRRGTTDLTSTLEATNGITLVSTPASFTDQHLVITGITGPATPPVVTTSTNHGLATGDRVMITKVIGTMADEINNNNYVVTVLSATTFSLYDTFGIPVAIAGAYTSSGQVTKIGPELGIVNNPAEYSLTLGTTIIGAVDNAIIYFTAWQFNNYVNIGDTA